MLQTPRLWIALSLRPVQAKSAIAGLSRVVQEPFILLTKRHDLHITEKGSRKEVWDLTALLELAIFFGLFHGKLLKGQTL